MIDLGDIDIRPWQAQPPAELMLADKISRSAAMAIKYGRAGGDGYDEIGFRTLAAATCRGAGALRTCLSSRFEDDLRGRLALPPPLRELEAQQAWLAHRPLAPPIEGGFAFDADDSFFYLHPGPGQTWTYRLEDIPTLFPANVVAADAGRLIAHADANLIPGAFWLPLSRLIADGRFRPMQQVRDALSGRLAQDACRIFVSHRWLTAAHPDPSGAQAQSLAWQLVGAIAEAMEVVAKRGLDEPRAMFFGHFVGCHGSALAESLLVNVVRPAIDRASLSDAVAEARQLPPDPLAAAPRDAGLQLLAGILERSPLMRSLIDRIHLWYDFSCLPQAPRSSEDDTLFRHGLMALGAIQSQGWTVVMADDADDYLGRAWCVLEAVSAHRLVGQPHILAGARAMSRDESSVRSFDQLAHDRSHLVWRAVLDTVVFEVQDFERCAQRLGVAVTAAADMEVIRRALMFLRAPLDMQTDESEIITGVLPLPLVDSRIVLAEGSGIDVSERHIERTISLDWTGATDLGQWTGPVIPSFVDFQGSADRKKSAHLAVAASCEGEAVLFAGWVTRHRAALEDALGVALSSMSWCADDVAPVGHLADGQLRAQPLEAGLWVVVATRERLAYGSSVNLLKASIARAGQPLVEIMIDVASDNVRWLRTKPQPFHGSEPTLADCPIPTHAGGLFRDFLASQLLAHEQPEKPVEDPLWRAQQLATHGRFVESSVLADRLLNEIGDTDSAAASAMRARLCAVAAGNASQLNDLQRALELRWIAWAELDRRGEVFLARSMFEEIVETETALAPADDPQRWIRSRIVSAQQLADSGEYARSNRILNALLDDIQWTRHLAMAYVGKVWGLLGANHHHLQQAAEARRLTTLAHKECVKFGDPNGAEIYRRNLAVIGG